MSKDNINIAAIVPYKIYPAKMGGQKGIAFFFDHLNRLLPVTIISTNNNILPENHAIKIIPLLGHSKLRYINPLLFFKLRKLIHTTGITHLILEHPYYGWLGLLLKWSCRVKLVIHSHNIEGLRFKSLGRWWWGLLLNYEKITHRKANLNFFIHDEDREFGIRKFRLEPSRCFTITYGFELAQAPLPEERIQAKENVCNSYNFVQEARILLFNGTLDYLPNRKALDIILDRINPMLIANKNLVYRIIICGSKLPSDYHDLMDYRDKNIIYAGFVEDITLFFKAADIFINPVTDGGGIKTKVVEALGYNLSVISTAGGATGIPLNLTGGKLKLIADDNWQEFADEVVRLDTKAVIPIDFYRHFYWGWIAERAAVCITNV